MWHPKLEPNARGAHSSLHTDLSGEIFGFKVLGSGFRAEGEGLSCEDSLEYTVVSCGEGLFLGGGGCYAVWGLRDPIQPLGLKYIPKS